MAQGVLLADDDASFREQLEAVIERVLPGAQIVASVADGHTAVAAAMTHAPAFVVIDYAMPGPDGAHAAAVIRQALPGARIVILSGQPADELVHLLDDMPVVRKGPGMEEALAVALA